VFSHIKITNKGIQNHTFQRGKTELKNFMVKHFGLLERFETFSADTQNTTDT